jgi:hypothetical protein
MIQLREYLRKERKRREEDPRRVARIVRISAVLSVLYLVFAVTLALHPRNDHELYGEIASIAVVCVIWLRYGYDRLSS